MNIVFDLGGVVFRWDPDTIIGSTFNDAETRALVKTEVFEHADWIELDRGTISFAQAVERGAARTDLPPHEIERLLHAVPRSLVPVEETIELIRSICKSNNRLFVLSNMQYPSIAYLEKRHKIWDMFDGIVISCRIQMVKPEIRIYEYLLAKHQLAADETVFIDDMRDNLTAAATLGIHTIQFIDAAQCRQDLKSLGYLT